MGGHERVSGEWVPLDVGVSCREVTSGDVHVGRETGVGPPIGMKG